jgi:serine/threonine-protein kinase
MSEAREALREFQQLSSQRYVPPYSMAVIHMGLDEQDEALAWLERAADLRDPFLMFLKVDPRWKNIRQDSRFIRLLKRMNL